MIQADEPPARKHAERSRWLITSRTPHFEPSMTPKSTERSTPDSPSVDWLAIVSTNVTSLRFGSVQITVHEGRVTQVETIEKTRFVAVREEGNGKKA